MKFFGDRKNDEALAGQKFQATTHEMTFISSVVPQNAIYSLPKVNLSPTK